LYHAPKAQKHSSNPHLIFASSVVVDERSGAASIDVDDDNSRHAHMALESFFFNPSMMTSVLPILSDLFHTW